MPKSLALLLILIGLSQPAWAADHSQDEMTPKIWFGMGLSICVDPADPKTCIYTSDAGIFRLRFGLTEETDEFGLKSKVGSWKNDFTIGASAENSEDPPVVHFAMDYKELLYFKDSNVFLTLKISNSVDCPDEYETIKIRMDSLLELNGVSLNGKPFVVDGLTYTPRLSVSKIDQD